MLEPIGQGLGGMGELFLCYDPSLDRKVVVKRVPENASEELLNRFNREACLLSGVAHPGYAHVYRYWLVDGRPAMAMEFIDGLTLREILDLRRRIPGDVALCIGWSVAEALRHAHIHGIIHRDVKPANILVSHDGQVTLLDFGVARFESKSDLTIIGGVVGTTAYMAPEQARALPLDERADLFALGLCLYEALGGEHPFRRPDPEETLEALLNQRPKSLLRLRPGIPFGVARLVSACLGKRPGARPSNATDFLRRLDRIWGAAARDREAYLAAFMAALRAGHPFETSLPRRSSAWGGLLLFAAGAALAAGGAWLLLHR